MKLSLLLVFYLLLSSCSSLRPTSHSQGVRRPAESSSEATSCSEIAKDIFLSESYSYKDDLTKALTEKKLLTFKEKIIQIQYPRLEWINRAKIAFNQILRNWNNNRYPAFYIFSDEEVVSISKKYVENLDKILTNQVSLDNEEATASYVAVTDWIKSFQNYKIELDQLIEERISLQYNISLLKKLKLNKGESRDILISIKRDGKIQDETISLHAEDKNFEYTIFRLKKEMKDLDGTFIRNGKIKERIIRQAMLQDMLTIVQRELEYSIKNSAIPNQQLVTELENLSTLIKNKDFAPSTYGIFKINDKVFIRELLSLSKIDVAYKKIQKPIIKIKEILSDYFKNKNANTDEEKIGFLKNIYAKITSISPKAASIGGASVVIGGIGLERYFAISKTDTKELGQDDQAHLEQLEATKKVEIKKQDAHAHAVEIQTEDLLK